MTQKVNIGIIGDIIYLYVVLCISKAKYKIELEKDILKWCEWKHLPFSHKSACLLFLKYREFRNQFYLRTGKISFLLRPFFKGERTLFLHSIEGLGGGLMIQHGFATIVSAQKIGENFRVYQQVTVGFKGDECPVIGNDVVVCCGAKVIGGITIGDNVTIGANAVVITDVPSNSIVVGVPGRIIAKNR